MKHKTSVLILIIVFTLINFLPQKTNATIKIFSPFGGKVESYNPIPEECITKITTPIAILTGFTLWVTVEEIKVGKPKGGTFGILRVNGISVMPPPTNIKSYGAYMVPNTWVLGQSINICNVCKKLNEFASTTETFGINIENLCKSIPYIGNILDKICFAIGSACPVTNLVYQIGTGLPSVKINPPSLPTPSSVFGLGQSSPSTSQ